jgi:hypothetical protein
VIAEKRAKAKATHGKTVVKDRLCARLGEHMPRRGPHRALGILAAAAIVLSSSPLEAPAKLDTVYVTGRGGSRWEARTDATRQALQSRVAQLIIADRAISGDALVRDDVLSTLNGFVESFSVIRERVENKETVLDTRVVVGTSNIQAYIARRSVSAKGVDGDDLLSKLQAVKEHDRSRGLMMERLLRGFPWDATTTVVDSIALDPDNRELARVYGTFAVAPGFLRQLTEGVAAIGSECTMPSCAGYVRIHLANIEEQNMRFVKNPRMVKLDGYASALPEREMSGAIRRLYDSRPLLAAVLSHERSVIIDTIHSNELSSGRTRVFKGCKDDRQGTYWWNLDFSATGIRGCIYTDPLKFFVRIPAKRLEGAKNLRISLLDDSKRAVCEPYLSGRIAHEFDQRVKAEPLNDNEKFIRDWNAYTSKMECVKVLQNDLGLSNLVPFYNLFFDYKNRG